MIKITAILAAAALALSACGSSNDTSSSSGGSASNSNASSGGGYSKNTTASSSDEDKSKSSNEVEMYDNYFDPKTISGKPGATVKIELKNEGQAEHNFKIDGQKADADVEPGKNATVSVTIPKSGSVQFYCEYHKRLGMTGTVKAS